jgi:TldD protein
MSQELISLALAHAKKEGLYAIVRVQEKKTDRISVTNGVTQNKRRSHILGMGVMVFTKEGACAFGSTDVLKKENVERLMSSVCSSARSSQAYPVEKNKEIFKLKKTRKKEIVPIKQRFDALTLAQKERKLHTLHASVRKKDRKMSVTSSYMQALEHWWIARSDGTMVEYTHPYSRIVHSMTKSQGKRTQNLFTVCPGIDSTILSEKKILSLLSKKVDATYILLKGLLNANPLKAGHYKALLTSGFSGLLAHEAVGHASESDQVRTSVLGKNGKLRKGEKVAESNISFVDGPVPGYWGDVRYSANGTERRTVTFIKDGVLVDSLSDVFTAKEVGVQINGADRAEYFHDISIPRMSNTRIVDSEPLEATLDPETSSLKEICAFLVRSGELTKGEKVVMPVRPMGGEVSPEAGTFMFNCAGIYVFEYPNKITLHSAASFGGTILSAIKTRMKGIGKSLVLTDVGMCGKSSQGAPVTDGSHPFLIFDKTTGVTFGGQ